MNILTKIKAYHFEIRHLIIVFTVLVLFQTILSYINTTSTSNQLSKTMELYRKDSAERLADLTTTSLELLLEHSLQNIQNTEKSRRGTIRAFNIILSQQSLQQNVNEICILISSNNDIYAIDDGTDLYSFFFDNKFPDVTGKTIHASAIVRYSEIKQEIIKTEQIYSFLEGSFTFHIFVPFVPMGELMGAIYMKIEPDFSNIAEEISATYNETGAIFSALILLALLAMFYMSSYMVKERDLAQQQLFEERKIKIKQQIERQKEAIFTQRIYHAHHKAEKIMGFIKIDLKSLSGQIQKNVLNKLIKYANFISRVIYDMKSYEPPVDVIRNPMFKTNINEVIQFVILNIFGRVYKRGKLYKFKLELDDKLPLVPVNEYIVWEIIEPLVQNSIDHNRGKRITIKIKTKYNSRENISTIVIEDDGFGIKEEFLQPDENGIKKIFLEHTTIKEQQQNSGYGCHLAYEITNNRCGWSLDAENIETGGARFIITVPHNEVN